MVYAFPFPSDRFEMVMDARAGVESLIQVEPDSYHAQLAVKQDILMTDAPYYFQCPPPADALAWEALETLLPDMTRALPQFFVLDQMNHSWVWTNKLLGAATQFTPGNAASLPRAPLDWLGRQVQEDLMLLDSEGVCVAGHVCFASGWALGDKIGKNFLGVHAEVPGFGERVGKPADALVRRLKAGRPVERLNWTIHATDRLSLAPKLAHEWTAARSSVTPENAGARCVLRLERQTLSRLPRTGGVLFTIHTYVHPMADVALDSARAQRLARVLRDMPAATRDYKGLTSYIDALIAYLETHA